MLKFAANIHLYQIVIVAMSTVMIYQGVANFRKGGQTLLKLAVRVAVWGGMALVAVWPALTLVLARIIGLEGNINAVILTGFLLVFLMIFKLLSTIERMEAHITTLTRKDALSRVDDSRKDRDSDLN